MDKILIVEVSKSLAFALKSTFEESDDISCFICHNMAEVKALINDHIDFSIALINLQLPDAPDGEIINLLKLMKALFVTGCLKI